MYPLLPQVGKTHIVSDSVAEIKECPFFLSTDPHSSLPEYHLPPPPFSMPHATAPSIPGSAIHVPLSMHCCRPRCVLWPQSHQILASLAGAIQALPSHGALLLHPDPGALLLHACAEIQEVRCHTGIQKLAAVWGSRSSTTVMPSVHQ